MRWVLDDEAIHGSKVGTLSLRPARRVNLVDEKDVGAAIDLITRAIECWGGASDLLVPVTDGAIDGHLRSLAAREDLDEAVHRVPVAVPINGIPVTTGGARVPSIAAALTWSKGGLRPLVLPRLSPDDPWFMSYVATIGLIPDAPSRDLVEWYALRQDVAYEDLITMHVDEVADPGAHDLLDRVAGHSFIWPIDLSLLRLKRRPLKQTHWALDGWLADGSAYARQAGSEIVVVYSPDRVGDLALLWNLRRLHGWPRSTPLGVPFQGAEPTAADIEVLLRGTQVFEGFPIALVTYSVESAAMTAIAALLAERGFIVDVVTPADLLVPSSAPVRESRATMTFIDGTASVPTRTDLDRSEIGRIDAIRVPKSLVAVVDLDERPLVGTPTLRAKSRFSNRVGERGIQVNGDLDTIVSVTWPASWTLLEKAAEDVDLRATPSQVGIVAHALLERVGDIDSLVWFASRPLLDLLYRVAESSGLSYWKKRSVQQAARIYEAGEVGQSRYDALVADIDDLRISRGADSAPTFGYSEVQTALGKSRSAATSWLRWAEDHELVVRGAKTECGHCRRESWTPMAMMGDLSCQGCGRAIEHPFPSPSSLNFAYTLAEPLRRAMEHDALYPLLVMRALWARFLSSPVPLVGLFPGVDFFRGDVQREADIVALLADGRMIVAEVKRTARFMDDAEISKANDVAVWLGCENLVLAVGNSDAELPQALLDAARTDALPRRLLMTAEDWLDPDQRSSFASRFPGPDLSEDQSNPREHDAAFWDEDFPSRVAARLTESP